MLQLTETTSFLDASHVYGPSDEIANSLRHWEGGRLRADYSKDREFPPSPGNKTSVCDLESEQDVCYLTGKITIFNVFFFFTFGLKY